MQILVVACPDDDDEVSDKVFKYVLVFSRRYSN